MHVIPEGLYREILVHLPILCVDVAILHEDKCLLLERSREPARGTLWFAGGRLEKGETLAHAAVRKALEETGLECTLVRMLGIEETIFPRTGDMTVDVHTVQVGFAARCDDLSTLRLDENHRAFRWVDGPSSEHHPAVNRLLVQALGR
jgi:ADP-ribose pyrophosphatase YjhB (NUDIX family)